MRASSFVTHLNDHIRRRIGLNKRPLGMHDTILSPKDARDRPEIAGTDLGNIFLNNDRRIIHKWAHYFEIYERHFDRYRNTAFRMMEIGVFKGGSLQMWRDYFGQDRRDIRNRHQS